MHNSRKAQLPRRQAHHGSNKSERHCFRASPVTHLFPIIGCGLRYIKPAARMKVYMHAKATETRNFREWLDDNKREQRGTRKEIDTGKAPSLQETNHRQRRRMAYLARNSCTRKHGLSRPRPRQGIVEGDGEVWPWNPCLETLQ